MKSPIHCLTRAHQKVIEAVLISSIILQSTVLKAVYKIFKEYK